MDSAASPPRANDRSPTITEIEAIAAVAYETIPTVLRARIDNVAIQVVDFPDDDTCRDMGLETPFDLLGLYQGVDLPHRSISDPPREPDVIFLYRRPMIDFWAENEMTLGELVRHVLIHEIGHHFGFSDADMDALERQN
ncbi:MAG: metallopeptidase family protein [Alphaproteobacteria bacterium]|nr:metallopeptidase family protein [Alphaproteobacteria bacterium]